MSMSKHLDYSDNPFEPIVNVPGTANIAAGYRTRNRMIPKHGERWRNTSYYFDENYNPRIEELKASLERNRMQMNLDQDQRLREKKIMKQNLERRVQLGLVAYDEDLEVKRDKLRELLVREEAALTRELIEEARKQEELRAILWAKRIEEVEREKQAARERVVEEKLLQRFVESNEQLRVAWLKAHTVDAKLNNLVQIADNQEKRKQEEKDEEYWNELEQKLAKEAAAREAEELARRMENELRGVELLKHQMVVKSQQRQAEMAEKASGENFYIGKPNKTEAERKAKQRQFREDLENQLSEVCRCIDKRCQQGQEVDQMTLNLDRRSQMTEEEKRRERAIKNREIASYMKSLKEFREAVARREQQADDFVRRWSEEINGQRHQERLRAKTEMQKRTHELRFTWDKQVAEKCSRQQLEEEKERQEHERLRFDPVEEEQMMRAERRKKAQNYGRELIVQKEESVAKQEEERRFEEQIANRQARREVEEERLARQLICQYRV